MRNPSLLPKRPCCRKTKGLEATYEEFKHRGHEPVQPGAVPVWKLPMRNPSNRTERLKNRIGASLEATYEESKQGGEGEGVKGALGFGSYL